MLVLSRCKAWVCATLLATSVCGGLGRCLHAAEHKVDFSEVAKEVMKMRKDGDSLVMAFWLPPEYLAAALDGSPRVTADQKASAIKLLSPYTIIAVVDGNVGPFAEMTFRSKEDIRSNIHVTDGKGNKLDPLDEDDISGGAKVFLGAFAPAVANMMGPMGKNMHVFLFPAKGDDGKALFAATSKGALRLSVDKTEFRWRLPLGSLLPPKECARCKEQCSGAWEYCPWCGERLSTADR